MKIRALFSTVTLKNFSRSSTIGSPRKNDGFSPTTFGVTGERSPAIQYRNLLHLLLKAEKLRGADLLKSKFPSSVTKLKAF